jgi:hypothetical protein
MSVNQSVVDDIQVENHRVMPDAGLEFGIYLIAETDL